MYSRSTKLAVAAFALVAMMVVQLSGGIANYYCDCTGTALITFDEHCHGDHGEEGPLDHAPSGHQHHDDDDHDAPADSDGHHHHELVKTPTDAVPTTAAAAPAPTISIAPVLWIEIPDVFAVPAKKTHLVIRPPRDSCGPPPLPLVVTRSVVFLI